MDFSCIASSLLQAVVGRNQYIWRHGQHKETPLRVVLPLLHKEDVCLARSPYTGCIKGV